MDGGLIFTAVQAIKLIEFAPRAIGVDKNTVLERILCSCATPLDARTLLSHTLKDREQLVLRQHNINAPGELGASMWKVVTGNSTGHYSFDLAIEEHRTIARALARVAATERDAAMAGGADVRDSSGDMNSVPDTSQYGDHLNYRNVQLDGKPLNGITPAWFAERVCPTRGRLELDYVSTTRPRSGSKPMTDKRFTKLLHELGLDKRVDETQRRLNARNLLATIETLRKNIRRSAVIKAGGIDPRLLRRQTKKRSLSRVSWRQTRKSGLKVQKQAKKPPEIMPDYHALFHEVRVSTASCEMLRFEALTLAIPHSSMRTSLAISTETKCGWRSKKWEFRRSTKQM